MGLMMPAPMVPGVMPTGEENVSPTLSGMTFLDNAHTVLPAWGNYPGAGLSATFGSLGTLPAMMPIWNDQAITNTMPGLSLTPQPVAESPEGNSPLHWFASLWHYLTGK